MLRDKRGIYAVLVLVCTVELVVLFLPPDLIGQAIREDGPIETGTAGGFLFAACWLCIEKYRGRLHHGFYSGMIVLALALREADFHDRFTTMGIFKTRFYVSSEVPFSEKIIVSVIVLSLFAAVLLYIKTYGPQFMQALRRKDISAICVAIALALAGISKILDSYSGEINAFVISFLHLDSATVVTVSEEVLELGIPLFILLAICYGTVRISTSRLR